jgi:hypothetical protein
MADLKLEKMTDNFARTLRKCSDLKEIPDTAPQPNRPSKSTSDQQFKVQLQYDSGSAKAP